MFKLFDSQDEDKVTLKSIGNIAEGRQNLGEDMPVYVYRLFEYATRAALTQQLGKDTAANILRCAGAIAGKEFASYLLDLTLPFNEFVAQLQSKFTESKIGILRIEELDMNAGKAVLTVSEDLDCSGMPITGETICNYDEGFLAAVLEAYTGKEYRVVEVDCWATGSRTCRFEANVKNCR